MIHLIPVMISLLISRMQGEKNNIHNVSFDSNDSITASLSSSFDGNKKYINRGTTDNSSNARINLKSINNNNVPKSDKLTTTNQFLLVGSLVSCHLSFFTNRFPLLSFDMISETFTHHSKTFPIPLAGKFSQTLSTVALRASGS